MTNGVIIDAESRLLLIAMVGYHPNEYTNTHINAHTHTQFPPSVSCSHTNTHKHTPTFSFFQVLGGALMHINLPPQLINLLTQTSPSQPLETPFVLAHTRIQIFACLHI